MAAVIFLLALSVLQPVLQNLDPWDIFPDAGDNLIVVLLIAGACLALVLTLSLLLLTDVRCWAKIDGQAPLLLRRSTLSQSEFSSPPLLALRV